MRPLTLNSKKVIRELSVNHDRLQLLVKRCSSYQYSPKFVPARRSVRSVPHQVEVPELKFSRPETRAPNSSRRHTWSPAALYSGQWCFVSRSRSNASHQTIWARASNWTSTVSTTVSPPLLAPHQPVGVSQRSRHLICSSDLTHFMGRFHPFNHLDYKMQGNRMSFVATGGLALHVYVAWHAQPPTSGYLGGWKIPTLPSPQLLLLICLHIANHRFASRGRAPLLFLISSFTGQREKFFPCKEVQKQFCTINVVTIAAMESKL